MSLQITNPARKVKQTVTFRPAKDVATMLERASKDHPILSGVINECIRQHLTRTGYARKREATAAHESRES